MGESAALVLANEASALDNTSWKVEITPDSMAKDKGEKEFKETLTFVDGKLSTSELQKMGFDSALYTATKAGEKDWSFNAQQESDSQGKAVWTGTAHSKAIDGKLIWTKKDGSVFTFDFKGEKLG